MRKFLSALRAHKAIRFVGITLMIAAVLLSAAIVTSLTVDLGPSVRQGSRLMKRDLHIGNLKIRLFRGRVELDDLMIEGLQPTDRPFFVAKHLSFSLDWSRLAQAKPEFIVTSVEMTDWKMLVERWADGHNFIKIASDNPSNGPSR